MVSQRSCFCPIHYGFSPWVLRHRSSAQRNLTAVFLNNFIIRTELEVSLRIEKNMRLFGPRYHSESHV